MARRGMRIAAPKDMRDAQPTTPREGLPRGAVLVATELGDAGARAIAMADPWARRMEAPLVVSHATVASDAIFPLLPHLYRPFPDPEEIATATARIRAQVSNASDRHASDYDIALEQGSPHAAIVSLAQQIGARLLVIGASQKGSVEHALLGSTAEQIVRHSPCAVLLAKTQKDDGPIVVATDFSDASLAAELCASEQTRLWQRDLVVVHALDIYRPLTATFEPAMLIDDATIASLIGAARELANARLGQIGARGKSIIELGDPSRVVVEQAKRLGAWLVVVATHGRTGLKRMALGSIAERIARTAPCPVLVARSHEG
jgi:nucleotide-binding universal stress UspA family protein